MSVLALLSSNNFIIANRTIAKIVGLNAAVILGEIASEFLYWQDRDELENGYFYSTVENLEERTFLSAYEQRVALAKLQDQGFINVKKMGMPAKRYIRIFEDQIAKVIDNKTSNLLTTSGEKISQQDVKNFDGNKNITNKNIKDKGYIDILDQVPVIIQNPDLKETFIDFIKMRKLIKAPLTERALKMIINQAFKLSSGKPNLMKEIVDQSIKNNWKDVYPLKETTQSAPVSPTFAPDCAGGISLDKLIAKAEEQAERKNKT